MSVEIIIGGMIDLITAGVSSMANVFLAITLVTKKPNVLPIRRP